MSDNHSIEPLNGLLATLCRSLPMYLEGAPPWTHPGSEKALETLASIRHDQQAMAQRVAELIQRRRGAIDDGSFPMSFTDTNFLSLDFLLAEMTAFQWRDIATIEACVAAVPKEDPQAKSLAEEALGEAKAHLEALQDLTAQVA